MKFFRHLKVYLILVAIIVIAVLLILNEYLIYGFILAGIAIFVYSAWQLFVKRKDDEIAELESKLLETEKENTSLETENLELKSRKLNFAEIKNIADLGLMEVDTNFTRTWNEKREHEGKNIHLSLIHISEPTRP